MANNRELSQLGSFINIDDTSRNIGIATTATPYVGIGTTNPQYKLDVYGDINFTENLYKNGELFIGTGITVTGYGSTVVVDMTSISAATAGTGGASDDVIRLAIAFG